MERTWVIRDVDGSNPRTVTLAQYRAELAAAKARVAPVVEALRRGDHDACAAAQRKARA